MKFLCWEKLAKIIAQSKTIVELEFSIIEELKKQGLSEEEFFNKVKEYGTNK